MVYGAIDLHMRYSQIRVLDAQGGVLREQRLPTTAERLAQGPRELPAGLLETIP